MTINRTDLEKISRVLDIPLGAFGLELLIKKTNKNKEELQEINRELGELQNKSEINFSDLGEKKLLNILSIFSAAIETINETDDIQTMTGFSIDEVNETKNKLAEMLRVK